MVGRATSAVIGFALPIILARRLDATAYGGYKQIYLVANLAMYSLQLGLAQSLFYFVPRAATEDERRAFIGQTQLLLTFIGVLTAGALYLAAPAIAVRFSNPVLADLAAPLGLLAGGLVASSAFEVALTSRGKPAWSAGALIASDVLRVTAMLAVIQLGKGLPGLAWAAAVCAVIRWVAALALGGSGGRFFLRGPLLRQQLVYSLPFGVAVLLQNQQLQLHQIYISTHASPALFALYAVGCMQIPVVSLLYAPVSETLQVQLGVLERTGQTHKAGVLFSEAVGRLALAFLPMCALLMTTARPGLHVLYQGRYDDAAAVLRIAVLSVAIASLPVDGLLKARARTGSLLILYAAKLAVTWPLLGVGYRLAGMEGAISAHVGVELLTKAAQVAIVARDLELPAVALLGGRELGRSLLLAAAVAAASGAAVAIIPRPVWACVAAGLVGVALVGSELRLRQRRPAVDGLAREAA
jgi:O-antigen/teichoic acid export membrane protein